MIEKASSKEDVVIWQLPNSEEDPIPEPAIMVKEYGDIIALVQEGREILINKNPKNLRQLMGMFRLKMNALQEAQ